MRTIQGNISLKAICLLLITSGFLGGCSNLRYLDDDQRLYTGSLIHLEMPEKIDKTAMIENELQRMIRPVPNQRFIVWRPRLWLYNIAGEPTGKGLRHLMRNRLGRPPALFNIRDVERNQRLMENRLFNMGYFDAAVDYQVHVKEKKASVDYFISLPPPYVFGSVFPVRQPDGNKEHALHADTTMFDKADHPSSHHPSAHHTLVTDINGTLSESLIMTGSAYRLDVLKAELMRIDKALKQRGYFYFHPDHILFLADTLRQQRKVDIYPTIKPGTAHEAMQTYRIGKISVIADHLTAPADTETRHDGLLLGDGFVFYDALAQISPGLIQRAIFLRSGEQYDIRNHDQTLAHLSGLGLFQFMNMRFSPGKEAGQDFLDIRILLSPATRKKLSAELRAVSKSNNFAGPGLAVNFNNINLFGGAEHLRLGLTASYEALMGRQRMPASSWEFGVESALTLPGFVLMPSGILSADQSFLPKTRFSLALNFLNRTDAFGLTSVRMHYGYEWNQSLTVRHRLTPMVFNLFVLGQVSEQLNRLLANGPLLKRGLFEQFIMGSEYSWFYNSQLKDQSLRQHDFYINLNLDLADPSREKEGFFEPVRPLDRQWRRNNLVLNLAIGYPF